MYSGPAETFRGLPFTYPFRGEFLDGTHKLPTSISREGVRQLDLVRRVPRKLTVSLASPLSTTFRPLSWLMSCRFREEALYLSQKFYHGEP